MKVRYSSLVLENVYILYTYNIPLLCTLKSYISLNIPAVGYIGFAQSSYTVGEGDGIMDVCVELLGDERSYVLGKPLSMRLSTDGETAEGGIITTFSREKLFSNLIVRYPFSAAGVDFLPITQITYFPPGSEPGHRTCVSIPIVDDALEEYTEVFTLHLFIFDTSVVVTNDVAVGSILDNDSKRFYLYRMCNCRSLVLHSLPLYREYSHYTFTLYLLTISHAF